MGLGFSVTNDNGYVQVIDTAPLMTYKDAYTAIIGEGYEGYVDYDYIFAYVPANGHQIHSNTFRKIFTGDRYRHKLLGAGKIVRFNEGASPLSTERFGLEVYNDKRELQFSSNQKPLKVLDVYQSSNIRNDVKTVNGRRTYWSKNYGNKEVGAIVMSNATWGESPYFMHVAVAKRGNVLAFEAGQEHEDRVAVERGGGVIGTYNFRALIVDVTGY